MFWFSCTEAQAYKTFINWLLLDADVNLAKEIEQHAMVNAAKFGKAKPEAVLGKILAEHPELKKDIPGLLKQIHSAIHTVNSLPKTKLERVKIPKKEQIEEPKGLVPLINAKPGEVVMRFEPSPSGPLHIGHAYTLTLNSEYCRKYNGKLILRIADTNPEAIQEEAYKLIPEDADWVTKGNIKEVIIQSDNLPRYYQVIETLLKNSHAYVCACKPEAFKKLLDNHEACPCRYGEESLARWEKMLSNAKEGSLVVRMKADLTHPNPSLRDFPLARIKTAKHPRTGKKFRVWPLLNLAVAVDDHDERITHTIRAKDHADNEKKQEWIFNSMEWMMPEHLYVGKINFTNLKLSTRTTAELIRKKKYTGWDDIRLPFLLALKRRGYQPDAIIKYAIDMGVSSHDKTVSQEEFMKTLNAFNKDIVDPIANRYFFVDQPKKIIVGGAPPFSRELDLHPTNKKGGRMFNTKDTFYITPVDYKNLKQGKVYRLMGCLNFVKKKGFYFHSREYEHYKGDGMLHYLPVEKGLPLTEVSMPDGSRRKGLAEKGIQALSPGTIIQFERFGFVILDTKEKGKYIFWYLHK